MKKLLIFMLVLGMASTASAALVSSTPSKIGGIVNYLNVCFNSKP